MAQFGLIVHEDNHMRRYSFRIYSTERDAAGKTTQKLTFRLELYKEAVHTLDITDIGDFATESSFVEIVLRENDMDIMYFRVNDEKHPEDIQVVTCGQGTGSVAHYPKATHHTAFIALLATLQGVIKDAHKQKEKHATN